MKTTAPVKTAPLPETRLADYRPPAFLVDAVALDFDIQDKLTRVTARLSLRRNPAADFEQGETMDEFADRILAALLFIGRHYPGQRILVITHGWVMDVITRHVAGLPRNAILNMKRKNGETLWLEVTGQAIGRV